MDEVLQQVSYARSGLRCRIAFDHSEMSVMAEVEVDLDDTLMITTLDNLVSATGIAPKNKIPHSVHTLRSLGKALAEQAKFLRSILPYLEEGKIRDLMELAGARQWHTR